MEREQNEEHTKEESRTLQSEFEVNDYIPLIAFNVCSLGLCLFFLNDSITLSESKLLNYRRR